MGAFGRQLGKLFWTVFGSGVGERLCFCCYFCGFVNIWWSVACGGVATVGEVVFGAKILEKRQFGKFLYVFPFFVAVAGVGDG